MRTLITLLDPRNQSAASGVVAAVWRMGDKDARHLPKLCRYPSAA